MKRFPGRYKFILQRYLTTGEQNVIVEQIVRKKVNRGGMKPMEAEKFDDLRSFSLNDDIAVVTLEVVDIEVEQELLEMLNELKIIWNQQKGIKFGVKELKTID